MVARAGGVIRWSDRIRLTGRLIRPKTCTPQDVADPGDDLLGRIRLGKVLAGTLLKPSWKFPSSYEPAFQQTLGSLRVEQA